MTSLSSDPDNLKRWIVIKNWLNALDLILPPTPDIPEDALEILGLIEDLRNGEILCRLANRLKPGSVDSIQSESHNTTAVQHNVSRFTQACEAFGLLQEDVFKPDDLVMGDNHTSVLVTLEALYRYASSLGLGKQFTKHSLRRKSSRKMEKPSIPQDWRRPPIISLPSESVQEHVVRALYPFQGTEVDELSFQAGDRILVRSVLDGKWWEGECNGRSGWFPGNYVTELSSSESLPTPLEDEGDNKKSSLQVFYNLDIQDMLDALRTYRDDLHHLYTQYLIPLAKSNILPKTETTALQLNVNELVGFESQQFDKLEEICSRSPEEQTVGEFLLENLPQIENLYFQYSAAHPKALSVITENSDTISGFVEKQGGASPGMITLSLYLGKPMKMLEKYATQLLELERHIPETHEGLAAMKEAAAKFKLLNASVQEVRKRKEVELDMVTAKVDNWGGKNLEELGECCYSTQVYMNMDFQQTSFVLMFSGAMAVLDIQQSMSGYALRELYDLSSVRLSLVQNDTFYPIEIHGNNSMEVLYCEHSTDRDGIMQSFELCKKRPMNRPTFTAPPPPQSPGETDRNSGEETPKRPIQRSRSDIPKSIVVVNKASGLFQPQLCARQIQLSQPGAALPKINRPLYWGFKSLRPLPPAKTQRVEPDPKMFMKRSSMGGYKKKRIRPTSTDTFTEAERKRAEEETLILRVAESYNTTQRQKLIPRHTLLIRYTGLDPQLPIEETSPTLSNLESQVSRLTSEMSRLRTELELEATERKRLETQLNSLQSKGTPL